MDPQKVLQYFEGSWQARGRSGSTTWQAKATCKWDLNQSVIVGRITSKSDAGTATQLQVTTWNPLSKTIQQSNFAAMGDQTAYWRASLRIHKEQEFFSSKGASTGFGRGNKITSNAIYQVKDKDRFAIDITDRVNGNNPAPDIVVEFERD